MPTIRRVFVSCGFPPDVRVKTHKWFVAAVAGIACAWSSAAAGAGAVAAPLKQTIPDIAGRPITIDVTVGQLTVVGWNQTSVQVDIVPDEPAGTDVLDVGVDDGVGEVAIRAVQRKDRRDPEVRAKVTVRVPSTAVLARVAVFEGSLSLEGLRGDVRATIERGPLNARGMAGIVRLETASGDLSVADAELVAGGLLKLRTFNGNIKLALLRRPADARILVLTLNGAIQSDLPLETHEGFGPRFREGLFGRGEPLISLDAVRGNVTITAPER